LLKTIIGELQQRNVTVLGDENISKATNVPQIESELIWYEEFLDYKIVIGTTNSNQEAIDKINKYCGGHSASIITKMMQLRKNSWKMWIQLRSIKMLQPDLQMEDNLV
jgi:gamma-glutamyl phosphate reductase